VFLVDKNKTTILYLKDFCGVWDRV